MYSRKQVSEKNYKYIDWCHLALFTAVGSVSSSGMGRIRAGTLRFGLLCGLGRVPALLKRLFVHYVFGHPVHPDPMWSHTVLLRWHRLEAPQGLSVHPEQ